jgi:hypothetical protein
LKEFRIHAKSLQPAAVEAVLKRARTAANGCPRIHALEKAWKRGMTLDAIREAVRNGQLVEYHVIRDHERALLRDRKGTCVVVDLNDGSIVTAFTNNPTDHHATLRKEEYLFL